jgi:hypothetical protein
MNDSTYVPHVLARVEKVMCFLVSSLISVMAPKVAVVAAPSGPPIHDVLSILVVRFCFGRESILYEKVPWTRGTWKLCSTSSRMILPILYLWLNRHGIVQVAR